MEKVGKITHYFAKIGVAVVELKDDLNVGDEILIRGPQTDVKQVVESMQIDHDRVDNAKKGQSVGLKVAGRVREGDNVYRVST